MPVMDYIAWCDQCGSDIQGCDEHTCLGKTLCPGCYAKTHKRKIPTKDDTGKTNGYVIPVWNVNELPELRPDQVYLTAVAPHSQKGPHLHQIRRGLFCCIKGNVRLVKRLGERYVTVLLGEDHGYGLAPIPTGVAACLYNDGDEEALVLNMPSPAWSKDAPDEWPVENWNPTDTTSFPGGPA